MAFMAVVIGLTLRGSFYFFINAAIWELGSCLAAMPSGSSGLIQNSRQWPGLGAGGWGEVVAVGGRHRLVETYSEGFQEPSDPSGKRCLGAWLHFTGSVSVAGFIQLLCRFLRDAGQPGRCQEPGLMGLGCEA